ncbi:MAG: Efflux RND transporter periplasmic adaptor subunit, partial [Bacteroidetes bacterium]|nr:Efflux RND transporter periplasmic adaptor subunit [Bacteroidota bacterium]
MKKIIIIANLILTLVFGACSSKEQDSQGQAQATKAEPAKDYYTCPMHPSVVSDRPGACPVCGMALVKKTAQAGMSVEQTASLAAVSLSPSQRVLANVSSAVGVVDIAEPLQAAVSARFRGRIENLFVNYAGEVVEKNQALFELYSPDLVSAQQEYLLSINALQNANDAGDEQNREVQARLVEAVKNRLKVHFGMSEDQMSEISATKRVHNTLRFLSPIRGTVVLKQVQQGQYVEEGMLLYQLVDLSKVWILVDVYEQDLSMVHIGQAVHIESQSFPGESFHGKVTFIDPVVNGETRTARVRTEFVNSTGRIKPNMFVNARSSVMRNGVLTIPASAVLSTGKRTVVWVEVQSNVFEPRNVVLGLSSDGLHEILDGIHEGELVATSGGFLI